MDRDDTHRASDASDASATPADRDDTCPARDASEDAAGRDDTRPARDASAGAADRDDTRPAVPVHDATAPLAELVAVPLRLAPDEREAYEAARGVFAEAYRRYVRGTGAPTWFGFVRDATRTEPGRRALAAWRASRAMLAYPTGKQRALRELLAGHPDDRVLVFVADNPTAYAVARDLLVYPLTAELSRGERAGAIARFEAGELPALVSAGGFPHAIAADIAIVVGGPQRPRQRVRRIYELAIADSSEVDRIRRRDLARSEAGAVSW